MKKTSVYLTNDEAEGLRRVATATGKPQAALIREGVRLVIAAEESAERRFHSLGQGRGGGQAFQPWEANELYGSVMGAE